MMEVTEKPKSSYYSAIEIDTQVTHHVVAMKKVAEQHILTKCSKCNTFQVITGLVHDFMNFNALKNIKKKIIKKKIRQIQVSYSHKTIYLWPITYMQDMREILQIVTEKIVIKC